MNPIRAFVGHSFNADDEAVVTSFLKYLDGISEALAGFSWSHAEHPEPKIVAEKVFALLEDRNVFIGICTRKEFAVSPQALRPAKFSKKRLTLRIEDAHWKTSDWIIQEIGLSLGLGLKIILLIEAGVRIPGELQGNLERIEFHRDAPERAFGKLLNMLSSISPRARAATDEQAQATAALAFDDSSSSLEKVESMVPAADWDQDQYDWALLRAIAFDKQAEAADIDMTYRSSPLYGVSDNAIYWEARAEYLKLRFGKNGKLDKLIEFAKLYPQSSRIIGLLGSFYESIEEFDKAAASFELAASAVDEAPKKLKYLRKVSTAKASTNLPAALEILAKMKGMKGQEVESERIILETERDIAKISKEDIHLVAVLEALVDLDPTDGESRFSLAYKYSERDQNELALFHYSKIPNKDRGGAVWNNLGAAFSELGMPVKSVDAYRLAEEAGETLAMSNLANKQLEAGFIKEAIETCEKAIAIKDHHRNVDSTFSRLKDLPEEEDKKETSLLEKTRSASHFYRDVGMAMSNVNNAVGETFWQGPDCVLTLVLTDAEFAATGRYERFEGLTSLLLGDYGVREPQKIQYNNVEYRGTVRGLAFFGEVTRKPQEAVGSSLTILGSANTTKAKVVMHRSSDGGSISVQEQEANGEFKYYSWARSPSATAIARDYS